MYGELREKPTGAALIFRPPHMELGWDKSKASLINSELIVGRRPEARGHAGILAVPSAVTMSANHFRVVRVQNLYVLLDDWPAANGTRQGSKNGTFVNSEIRPLARHVLREGDILYAGGILFSFVGD